MPVFFGFPYGSAGKESARNAGDPGLIPGLGPIPLFLTHTYVTPGQMDWKLL